MITAQASFETTLGVFLKAIDENVAGQPPTAAAERGDGGGHMWWGEGRVRVREGAGQMRRVRRGWTFAMLTGVNIDQRSLSADNEARH